MIEFDDRKDDLDAVIEAVDEDRVVQVIEDDGCAVVMIDGVKVVMFHPVDLVFCLAYVLRAEYRAGK